MTKENLKKKLITNVLVAGQTSRQKTPNPIADTTGHCLTLSSSTVPLMSQRQIVWSSLAESRWPFMLAFHERPYLHSNSQNFDDCRPEDIFFSPKIFSWLTGAL